jgi:hypothetical protein
MTRRSAPCHRRARDRCCPNRRGSVGGEPVHRGTAAKPPAVAVAESRPDPRASPTLEPNAPHRPCGNEPGDPARHSGSAHSYWTACGDPPHDAAADSSAATVGAGRMCIGGCRRESGGSHGRRPPTHQPHGLGSSPSGSVETSSSTTTGASLARPLGGIRWSASTSCSGRRPSCLRCFSRGRAAATRTPLVVARTPRPPVQVQPFARYSAGDVAGERRAPSPGG